MTRLYLATSFRAASAFSPRAVRHRSDAFPAGTQEPTPLRGMIDDPWRESTRTRRRVRLVGASITRSADMRCQAEVCLEWEGVEYRGKAEGVGRSAIEHRAAAEATLKALALLLSGSVGFRLVGTKAVHAFDDNVAIVALAVRDSREGEERHVIGAALAEDEDMVHGVARAVLNATNRLLGNFLDTFD